LVPGRLRPGRPFTLFSAGLRKAAARRLAEAGCTAHEIAAITGHESLKEVARYTKAVDQRRLAEVAMGKVWSKARGSKT
jgi:hypothetical protein